MTTPNVTPVLTIPVNRRTYAPCWHLSPKERHCNRLRNHTGRHLFALRHLDGTVREVWS